MRRRREDLLQTFFTVELASIDLSRHFVRDENHEDFMQEVRSGTTTCDFAFQKIIMTHDCRNNVDFLEFFIINSLANFFGITE
jgi:hypothetical protein